MELKAYKGIESALTNLKQPMEMRSSALFWEEFHNRIDIKITPAVQPNKKIFTLPVLFRLAASILLIASLLYFLIPNAVRHDNATNEVDQLEVFTSYSAMFIMNTPNQQGTVIWISDLKLTPEINGFL